VWIGTPDSLWAKCKYDGSIEIGLPDDIASAVLRDAMVMAIPRGVQRGCHSTDPCWFVWMKDGRSHVYDDRDHGNDPTRSLFAAFKAACQEKP
jgi:hypothetical protein